MKSQNRLVEFANSSFGFLTCFWREGAGRGAMMTTLLCRHPEQNLRKSAVVLGICNTFVMSDQRKYSPKLLLDFANTTLGFRRTFGENSKLVGGSFFGDDHDTVSQTPRTLSLHPSAHTPCTASKANPPAPRSGLQGRTPPTYSSHLCF